MIFFQENGLNPHNNPRNLPLDQYGPSSVRYIMIYLFIISGQIVEVHVFNKDYDVNFRQVVIYLAGVLGRSRKHFPYTTAASIMVGRNQAVPEGNRRSSVGSCKTLIPIYGRKGIQHFLGWNLARDSWFITLRQRAQPRRILAPSRGTQLQDQSTTKQLLSPLSTA